MDNIELRSEKVRNIIGQVPPWLVRFGLGLLFMLSIGLMSVAYFVKYNHQIESYAVVVPNTKSNLICMQIPYAQSNLIYVGQPIAVEFASIGKRTTVGTYHIDSISTTIHIEDNTAYFYCYSFLPKSITLETKSTTCININDTTQVLVYIPTKNMSFVERIID